METALSEPLRDPEQCFKGWVNLVRLLATKYGVVIEFRKPAEPGVVGDWDSATRTLLVSPDATIAQQVWLFQQLWNYLAIGPHAAPTARRQPLLRLVGSDEPPDIPAPRASHPA